MLKATTLLVDISDVIKPINDRLLILFHSGVLPNLAFDLAIDCWNLQYICNDNYEAIKTVVRNRVYRFIDKEPEENEEIVLLLVSCITDIISEIGNILQQAIPEETSHLHFVSMDDYNRLYIKVIFNDDNDVEYN